MTIKFPDEACAVTAWKTYLWSDN